jgi:hypothetical protein
MIQIKLVGMSMIFNYTKVHLSKCNGSWVLSTKQNTNFNIQTAAMFVFFIFGKNGVTKSCSSFEDLLVYKISWSHVDWCKFCIHLRSLNVHHFGKLKGYGIKNYGVEVTFNGMTSLLNFIKIYQLVQKLLGGTHTDRRTNRLTGGLITLTYLFKESRLKN